jgi:Tyrosine phosphatase family
MSTPRWAMEQALRELDQAYGGIKRYLLGAAGLTPQALDALRASLTS